MLCGVLAHNHAAKHINDFHSGVVGVVDDPFAAVEVGEGVDDVLVDTGVGVKDQGEAGLDIADVSVEAIVRVGLQVDLFASLVVDEVEVIHLGVLGVDAEGVS